MSDGTDMAGCIGRQPASEMKRSEIELGQREAGAAKERQPTSELGQREEKQANTSGVYLNARKTGRIKERNGI